VVALFAATGRRIGTQLQAAGRSLDAELSASLDMAREDLRAGVAVHLKQHCRDLGDRRAVNACLVAYLEQGMRRWHAGPYGLAISRAEQAFAAAEQQLEDVEWAAVDRLVPPRPGGRSYAEAAADGLRAGADVRAYRSVGMAPGTPPGGRGGRGAPLTIAGGVVGLGVAVLLGVPLVPTLAATAAGALGGRLLDHRRGSGDVGEAVTGFAKHAIGVQIDAYRDLVRSDLAVAFAARRSAVDTVFAELDRALGGLAERGGATGTPTPDGRASAVKDRVAALRHRLVELAD
ncbi:hypothetical protein ABZS66_60670, partial [Dactylosporangium sp. NPDC005572]|uniref:hypothetical protein n=1 Tax=Dactylosporangium sp. NPDC005572 TaxID=3156889 RepID=UPI0033BA74F7